MNGFTLNSHTNSSDSLQSKVVYSRSLKVIELTYEKALEYGIYFE